MNEERKKAFFDAHTAFIVSTGYEKSATAHPASEEGGKRSKEHEG